MTKKKPNFKGWKNVFTVLVAKPAKKAAKKVVKKAKAGTIKGLKSIVGVKRRKGRRS